MATNPMGSLRRSPRLEKLHPFPPKKAKKVHRAITRRFSGLQNLPLRNGDRNLRRSPRFNVAPFCGKSEQLTEKSGDICKISNVDDLLKTGYFNGLRVTCFSEKRQGDVPSIIKGGGFLCGCSRCNYEGKVLSAKMLENHAGAISKFQADHLYFGNGLNLHDVSELVKDIPEEDMCVKVLKLRDDLKCKQLLEESPGDPAKSITARRSKRKRRETGSQRTVFPSRNKHVELISEVEFRDETRIKDNNGEKLENDKPSESSNDLQKSCEGFRKVLKCYRRYNPERRLMDVQGLLSTGLLEGFGVTYRRNEVRLAAFIRGTGYECSCSSCANANVSTQNFVITAKEFERHAGEYSNNPNENIYLDNGMTLCHLVKELKGVPLFTLGNRLHEKLNCHPNYDSFKTWKGSFKMRNDSLNFRSDSERQPDSKQSSVQFISKNEVAVSEATKNTNVTGDAPHPGHDYSSENTDSNSDQRLNQPINSSNSNFCPIAKPIVVCNTSETFKDSVPEGTTDLAKHSVTTEIFQSVPEGTTDLAKDSVTTEIFQSKSRIEALISEATKIDDCMANSSHLRYDDSLKTLDSNSDQCLNEPNESISSNSQQCSGLKPTTADPAQIIIDSHSKSINDLAEVSLPTNTFEPYNMEQNSTPDLSGISSPARATSDCMSVACKGTLNNSHDELRLRSVLRKIRSPRTIRFVKRDGNFYAGPSSLAEKSLQNAVDCATACNATEPATEVPPESGSKEGLTDEEKPSLIGIVKRRDGNLHKRLFEEGGLPDGTVLTYRYHNKVLLTGVKQGNAIRCDCHNSVFAPSQFEAHAGMGRRRQPYRHIFNSDGKTLHELSLELPDIPRSSSGMQKINSRPVIHRQHKRRERIARLFVKKDHSVPTRHRLKRIFLSQKGVLVRCTICKEMDATLGNEADPKLVIFCNQCDRPYHIGCLEDEESFKIADVFNGNWFCCTECAWVHNSLKKMCALGAQPVPTPFFDLLKKPHTNENNLVNLSWQIFGGGNAEDRVLLSYTLQFFKSVFQPILLGKQDMMRQMVFGKQVAATGLDFRRVLFIMIKLDEEIVSVAALRVFGNCAAELPLATTSKLWREQGLFRMLLSLIEELLRLLQVRLLVSPVHDEMQSIWIDKFGFDKASEQKVQMLKEQHGVMLFEDTVLLEKKIEAVAD